jgi:DNA-binding response OmpR family regulator
MNLMLLDDDTELVRRLESVFESQGLCVTQYSDPAEAVGAVVRGEWAAAIVSLDLAGGVGELFLEVLGDLESVQLPVILTSARHGEASDTVQQVLSRFGPRRFLAKPIALLTLKTLFSGTQDDCANTVTPDDPDELSSVSVDFGLSDVQVTEGDGESQMETQTPAELKVGSRRRRAVRGVLAGLERGREGIEELVELGDDDLAPISLAPEFLQELGPSSAVSSCDDSRYELEIDDDESDEISVVRLVPRE